MFNFRNDYSQGAHPRVLEAIAACNFEGNPGYGADPHSRRAADLIRQLCAAPAAAVHFFVGGTAANLTAIAAFLRPWECVLCPDTGHINVHEGGAAEAAGHKIMSLPTPDGKLRPHDLEPVLERCQDTAMVLPRMVYISNATEVGTVYSRSELAALCGFCRAHGLLLFLDGARLGTALTCGEARGACGACEACEAREARDLTLPDLAALTDAFYIGGTKNGALMGEAMVLTNPDLQPHFFRAMKQRGAVLAKGFLLGVQFEALLEDGLYWDLARHSNAMAGRLRAGLEERGVDFLVDSPTNQLFPIFAKEQLPRLEELCGFEKWEDVDGEHTAVRFVTSFATRPEEVDGLLEAL